MCLQDFEVIIKVVSGVCKRMYATTIMGVRDTRWSTIQGCFASLLHVHSACEVFVVEYKLHADFPKDLHVLGNLDFFFYLMEPEYFI